MVRTYKMDLKRKTILESDRAKRSVSCSLGGQRGCKWTCRMRGYIYGECKDEESSTKCKCRKVSKVLGVLHIIFMKISHFQEKP